ncbi:MAG TPA: hypothetical protein P5217_05945 [Methanoregulaceae archaeon]|nr:hypothetical protein [Methanoregulaceae archaeon]HPD75583.1 hypothetical protein [Methanoregulaceae archaeon]HRY75804.1 hypothetical protein [Methanoregulaceae archaeon]
MAEESQPFRIVYRGMSDKTARYLEQENVVTVTGSLDTTLRFWNACDLSKKHDACLNLMAISLPEHAKGRYNPQNAKIVLERDVTLKCIGVAEFNKILTPDGTMRDIRLFAMEMKA